MVLPKNGKAKKKATTKSKSNTYIGFCFFICFLLLSFPRFSELAAEDALIRHAAFTAAKLLDAGQDFRPHEYSTMVCLGEKDDEIDGSGTMGRARV